MKKLKKTIKNHKKIKKNEGFCAFFIFWFCFQVLQSLLEAVG